MTDQQQAETGFMQASILKRAKTFLSAVIIKIQVMRTSLTGHLLGRQTAVFFTTVLLLTQVVSHGVKKKRLSGGMLLKNFGLVTMFLTLKRFFHQANQVVLAHS